MCDAKKERDVIFIKTVCHIWKHLLCQQTCLANKLRAQLFGDHSSDSFAKSLLELGNGEGLFHSGEESHVDAIGSPVTTLEDLKNKVFPNLRDRYTDHSWLCESAILAPKNIAVHKLNADLLRYIPGDGKVYKAIDTVTDPEEVVQYLI